MAKGLGARPSPPSQDRGTERGVEYISSRDLSRRRKRRELEPNLQSITGCWKGKGDRYSG